MPQNDDIFIKGTEYEEKFRLQAESELILRDLASLRRRLWDRRAEICQLERVLGETKDLKAEVVCLQAEIDSTVEKFGLNLMVTAE